MSMVGRQRRGPRKIIGSYILAPSRRGLFVIADETVITYLRFERSQEAFARRHWPPPNPVVVVDGTEVSAPPTGSEVAREVSLSLASTSPTSKPRAPLPANHPELDVKLIRIQISAGLLAVYGTKRRVREIMAESKRCGAEYEAATHLAIYHYSDRGTCFRIEANLANQQHIAMLEREVRPAPSSGNDQPRDPIPPSGCGPRPATRPRTC